MSLARRASSMKTQTSPPTLDSKPCYHGHSDRGPLGETKTGEDTH